MNSAPNAVNLRAKADSKEKEKEIEWSKLLVRIPRDVHKALKVRAAVEEKTIGEIVEGLIREYLVKGSRFDWLKQRGSKGETAK